MTDFNAGRARAEYVLDITQAKQAVAELKLLYANIAVVAKNAAKPPALPAARTQSFAAEQRAIASLEVQQARLARIQGDAARAADLEEQAQQRLSAALVRSDVSASEAIAIQKQLISAQTQAARSAQTGPGFGAEFASGIKAGLLGIVGPAALAAGAIAAVKGTVDSFVDAFKFKAALDQNIASITAQLRGVRDSSQAFDEARIFADRYKLTQEETTTAIQASVPLLRQSKASLTDVLTVLTQLQVLKPEQGIEGAAFALAELEGGQSRSLATRFNIPIAKATEMKNEIQKGGDAVAVLGKYLTDAGIGAEALAVRTQGAAGAINDLARAEERRRLAQAGQAGGAGLAILQAEVNINNALANALSSNANALYAAAKAQDGAYNNAIAHGATLQAAAKAGEEARIATLSRFTDAASQAAVAEAQRAAAAERLAVATLGGAADDERAALGIAQLVQQSNLLGGAMDDERRAAAGLQVATGLAATDIQRSAQASILDAAQKDLQQQKTAELAAETKRAVDAFLRLNPGIDASTAASRAAAQGYSAQVQQLIAIAIEADNARAALQRMALQANLAQGAFANAAAARSALDSHLGGGPTIGGGLGGGARAAGDQLFAQNNALRQSEFQLRLQQAKTHDQKIAILREELGVTTDQVEKNGVLGQIASEQQAIEAEKLRTAKSHTTELNKQLSLEERIRDSKEAQLKASLEVQKLAGQDVLDRLKEQQELAKAERILRSGRASDQFRQAAAAREQVISADQQLRQLDIAEKTLTAGGTIINGRVFQSRQGGGAPTGGTVAAAGGTAPASGGAGAPAAANVVILRLVDGALKTLAEGELPFIQAGLLVQLEQTNSAGQGRTP